MRSGSGARLRVAMVTPAPRGSRHGNRTTALRWATLLRELGHQVVVGTAWDGRACDMLVALHARRSGASIRRFNRAHPSRPLVIALTGTDLYHDLPRSARLRAALRLATRLVVLQPLAVRLLPPALRSRAVVIRQSVLLPSPRRPKVPGPGGRLDTFDVCVLAHLRPVKDPLRAARAARLLPVPSAVRVLQVGGAMSPAMRRAARAEEASNPRYRWLGELPRRRALDVLAGCRVMVLSSLEEGGANAVSEAIALGVPILASRIPGNVGLLGSDYPGCFTVGDTQALATLLHRAEADPPFLAGLQRRVRGLAPLISPRREREAWRVLLRDLRPSAGSASWSRIRPWHGSPRRSA